MGLFNVLQVGVVSDYDLLALDSISGNIKGVRVSTSEDL